MNTDPNVMVKLSGAEFADKMKSIREVMPTNLLTELDALGAFTNQIRWRLGDAVNKTCNILMKTGRGDMMDACWFVSIATNEFRTQNTLRGYAYTASFFSPAIRKTYCHDNLPFSHFSFAKSLVGNIVATPKKHIIAQVPAWEVCLQYSMEFYNQHGYCTSEARLRELFVDYLPKAAVVVPVPDPITGDEFMPYPVSNPVEVDGDSDSVADGFIKTVGNLFGLLPMLANLWPSGKAERVRKILDDLKNELEK